MLDNLDPIAPDPIFGLIDAFKQDPNPEKINLTAGIYLDETGQTPVLAAVKEAERQILDSETSKSYLPIEGSAEFSDEVRCLVLGETHEAVKSERVLTVQAPGGTGALRVAADFLRAIHPRSTVWITDPTWVNHRPVFAAAGLAVESFPYFDPQSNELAYERILETLGKLQAGDAVVLHACCHNPSGVDPTPEQWREIGALLRQRDALPILDSAYQGFDEDETTDADSHRILAEIAPELIICSSFSKNLGLYNERVGALTLVAPTPAAAQAALTHLKRRIRSNYSNPPAHGGLIVTRVLGEPELRQRWSQELAGMRERIRAMRRGFADGLDARKVRLGPRGNGFITLQKGMFSFSGLTPEQVGSLREEHALYVVGSGRISIAGMTPANLDRICDAIAAVVGQA